MADDFQPRDDVPDDQQAHEPIADAPEGATDPYEPVEVGSSMYEHERDVPNTSKEN